MSAGKSLQVAGVDVGSAAVKVVVLEAPAEGEATLRVGRRERIRRRDPARVTEVLFQECLDGRRALVAAIIGRST